MRQAVRTRHLGDPPTEPFATADHAWLWFCQCQIARREGASFTSTGGFARPCDPDDIHRAVTALHRRGQLARAHLRVLGRYGLRLVPPDGRTQEEARDAILWRQALDRLADALRHKGIVA